MGWRVNPFSCYRTLLIRRCDPDSYRRCPNDSPRAKACCRRAPTVLFIARDILATGVLFLECAFSSRWSSFVQERLWVRFLPFVLAFVRLTDFFLLVIAISFIYFVGRIM